MKNLFKRICKSYRNLILIPVFGLLSFQLSLLGYYFLYSRNNLGREIRLAGSYCLRIPPNCKYLEKEGVNEIICAQQAVATLEKKANEYLFSDKDLIVHRKKYDLAVGQFRDGNHVFSEVKIWNSELSKGFSLRSKDQKLHVFNWFVRCTVRWIYEE